MTLHFASPRAEVCLVFHKTGRGLPAVTDHRRELLGLLLEPIRAGFAVDLGAADPIPQLSSLIDVTGQALALYGMDGRELTQNPVSAADSGPGSGARRPAGPDPGRRDVRCSTGVRQNGASHGGGRHRQDDGTRREVATSQAAYRLRGNLVGRNALGHGTAVLVSLDRVAFQVPAPDSIRARYGLTARASSRWPPS